MVVRYGGIKLELSWKHILWGLAFKGLGVAVEADGGEDIKDLNKSMEMIELP